MEKIIVFREQILNISETFILKQVKFIKKFSITLVGLVNLKKLDISAIKYISLDSYSKIQVALYKLFGMSPKLVSIIKKQKPSLIHIHMGCDATRFVKIRKKLKVPILVTFHGTDATTTDEWKLKQRAILFKMYVKNKKELIATTNQFIAISEFVKKKMIEQGFPENKIRVHYIGIDLDFFQNSRVNNREPLILFVGRLTQQKGCEYLIRAMRIVQQNVHNAKLVIVGYGTEQEKLHKLSAELNVNCVFIGACNQHKVKELLSISRVFCCPSFSEGLGIVFLEAQAMGTPVVSFDSGGIPEAVINNQTGFLYKEKDTEGLAQGITKLLTDDFLWESFSTNGIKHVNKNFDIKKQTLLLEGIYMDTINSYNAIHSL